VKLRILICIAVVNLLLFSSALNCLAEADANFQQGLTACRAGQFAEAVQAFQKSAVQNPAAGTLLNLGIAQWRQGRAGEAIMNWEQAAWLDPFNAEAPNNLRYARNAAQVDAPELRWHEAASTWLPANLWAGIFSFSLWLAVAMIILPGVLRVRRSGWLQTLAALAFGVFLLSIPPCLGVITRAELGIVLEKNTALRLTPTREGEVVSSLTAGEAVRQERARGTYSFIRTSHGAGWVEQKQIGILSPR